MSLDPRIILGGQVTPVQNPLETLTTVAQLQGLREQSEARRLAADKARQEANDRAAVQQVFAETGGDMEKALPRLRQIAPAAALDLEKAWHEGNKEKAAAATHDLDFRIKTVKWGADMASMVDTPAKAQTLRPYLFGLSDEMKLLIPESDDPAEWQKLPQLLLSAKDRMELSREDLKLLTEGKAQAALGRALNRSTTQQEWDTNIQTFVDFGGPKGIAQMFGTFSPENVKRAGELALSQHEAETLAGQAETRAQTAAHNAVMEGQGAERVAIARQRAAQGAAGEGGDVKLTAAQQGEMSTMLTAEQLASEVVTLGNETQWVGVGPWEGRVGSTMVGSGGKAGETLRNKLGNIQATIALMRGGTSFTDTEKALLETYTPTITDSDKKIQTKLANLVDFIQKKRANVLRVAGGDYTVPGAHAPAGARPARPAGVNPFAKK